MALGNFSTPMLWKYVRSKLKSSTNETNISDVKNSRSTFLLDEEGLITPVTTFSNLYYVDPTDSTKTPIPLTDQNIKDLLVHKDNNDIHFNNKEEKDTALANISTLLGFKTDQLSLNSKEENTFHLLEESLYRMGSNIREISEDLVLDRKLDKIKQYISATTTGLKITLPANSEIKLIKENTDYILSKLPNSSYEYQVEITNIGSNDIDIYYNKDENGTPTPTKLITISSREAVIIESNYNPIETNSDFKWNYVKMINVPISISNVTTVS